ncbi:glutamate 5-kinase [Candidatus Peregrinibacteria bacterium RIFOXYB12_FULL_41_12]|nr:MAG: glutamate 5-kinase [Candidatus Peregrinibacteria bacterium RIFOXYA2_FULL_41_18]OGJ48445.1 MAG: glutamate 5-kinase [Candidatus Peregrinibacteria bacterium RIFOXYB12_FULL_41_12]OGJ53165.1 MAG: glutamate 5-kinase [Candidatus Peregrinibacteria bacterium RIFOXYB2_FULL_41_88]OGJ53446.1 MAG: glutamate 5-kinase [Candidatus Peregrinibacteria bacterium RIFOXYC2_FULL_41_22]
MLVVKVGTQVLLDSDNELDLNVLRMLSSEIALLRREGWHIVLVSSGAVGSGREVFDGALIKDKILQKQVLASIGQARLMHYYSEFFGNEGVKVAQILLERENFSDRKRFLSVRNVMSELLSSGIVPIVNENDVIADKELRFGDNDELATLLAVMLGAKKLVICSSIHGLCDCDPTLNKDAKVIKEVDIITEATYEMCGKSVSSNGLGGMVSKINSAKLATKAGIETFVINGKKKKNLVDTVMDRAFEGTKFFAQEQGLKGFQRWLTAGALSFSRIVVDDGAAEALLSKKSLLLVGVKGLEGEFEKRDTVDVYNERGENLAVGIVNYSSDELSEALKLEDKRNKKEVIHADNVVML